MTTSATRRKRPHPARRARRIVGSVTIAGMALLTAGMAVAGKLPTSPSVTTASTQSATGTASSTAGRSVHRRRGARHRVGPVQHVDPCQLSGTSARWAAMPT